MSEALGRIAPVPSPYDMRSVFEHDRGRILHSRSFRRLQHKTQVFAPQHRDFYRTRLTHSLECAQIGKALALNLWPEAGIAGADLTEAICLAHDIGHPPFGHSGEEILDKLSGAFEGNAQTMRVLVRLEEKRPKYGLDLTRATLASVIKYPFKQSAGKKKFLYDDDVKEFVEPGVFAGSPFVLYDRDVNAPPRPFPLQLMEWADDVAYSTHDIEDGINAGFISRLQLNDDSLRAKITNHAMKSLAKVGLAGDHQREVDGAYCELAEALSDTAEPPAWKTKALADEKIARFVTGVSRRSSATPGDWLYSFDLEVPATIRIELEVLKAVAVDCVFRDPRVTRAEFKGQNAVRFLYHNILKDAKSARPQILTRAWRQRFAKGNESAFPRIVCDYIAGMSDVFCLQLYAELTDPLEGSPFTIV